MLYLLARRIACLLAGLALGGCANLLPRGSNVTPTPFDSFEEARVQLEKIIPYQTTFEEIKALGFDPVTTANVTIIPYPEVISRLAPNSGVPMEALDSAVRDCILAQMRCRAYEFRYSREDRRRVGNFLLDFFNIRRTAHSTGWRFQGLIVVRNGVVLLRNSSGEPHVDFVEQQVNPLGPLQSGGELATQRALR